MMRFLLFVILTWALSISILHAQVQLGYQFGGMMGYDYQVGLPSDNRFSPYGKGQVGMMNFELNVGIPLGPVCLYPSGSWGISMNLHPMEDRLGDYLPLGYVHHQPASTQPETYLWSPEYSDLSAIADLEQQKGGMYALLHLGAGIELGTGIFYRRKLATITTVLYRDAYLFSGTDGTTDEYTYQDSWSEGISTYRIKHHSVAFPFVIQWRYLWEFAFCGTNFTYWVGGRDPYFSFNTTVGVNF